MKEATFSYPIDEDGMIEVRPLTKMDASTMLVALQKKGYQAKIEEKQLIITTDSPDAVE